MGAKRGHPGFPGSGRPKGSQSKTTVELKNMIRQALEAAGGVEYLTRQANENPKAFLTLVGKLIPADLKAELTGPDEGPLRIKIERILVDATNSHTNTDS